jgi:hypothetical protein
VNPSREGLFNLQEQLVFPPVYGHVLTLSTILGEVRSIRLVFNDQSPRGYGFVNFTDLSAQQTALKSTDTVVAVS